MTQKLIWSNLCFGKTRRRSQYQNQQRNLARRYVRTDTGLWQPKPCQLTTCRRYLLFISYDAQPTAVCKKDAVIVEERLNGDVKINFNGHYLNYLKLPGKPEKEINLKLSAITLRKPAGWKPPLNHPWRRTLIFNQQQR